CERSIVVARKTSKPAVLPAAAAAAITLAAGVYSKRSRAAARVKFRDTIDTIVRRTLQTAIYCFEVQLRVCRLSLQVLVVKFP
uniref:Uncharacterized protein n=1 Tax=Anopheles albimanus TaxID=7167 RepID=A0A182FX73_ANOAL